MRIGVIFFGLPRCSKITVPSIQRYILNELMGHQVFVQSCLSYQRDISNPRSGEASRLSADNYEFFKQYPCTLLSPQEMLDPSLNINLLEFGDSWSDEGKSLNNLLIQLFTLQTAYLKCKEHACDFYIFVRPDLLIQDAIPIKLFMKRFHQKNAVMIPSWQWWDGGVNDRFAMATEVSAEAFAMRYNDVLDYCENTQSPLHSELLLKHQLLHANVNIKTCSTKMHRVRVNGVSRNEDFSIGSLGVNKNIFLALFNQVSPFQFIAELTRVLRLFCNRGFKKLMRKIGLSKLISIFLNPTLTK